MDGMIVTGGVEHRGGIAVGHDVLHPVADLLSRIGGPEALVRMDDGPGLDAMPADALSGLGAHAGSLVQIASALGKTRALAALLARGIDPNFAVNHSLGVRGHTSGTWHHVLITPLCAALFRKRLQAADLLAAHGALYDVFTACYLGDLESVRRLVAEHEGLVEVGDPACDVFNVTPLHHAVYRGRADVAAFLLSQGAVPGPYAVRLLRWAQDTDALVALLLQHGARAEGLGPGKWVKRPRVAAGLRAHGADVNDPPGVWIWLACTGNSGHKEDLDYVLALLQAGADVHASYGGASALHYAARAGFARVVQALIDHGADLGATDRDGRRPIDWAESAGRQDVCRLLWAARS